ncbi:hypothetical protein [Haliovirga abyssi]|uniref:Porin n=1 Tax=Haliovirga abyssi TaxID=2996794 RepID=A0AAU9DZJ1_9FUSO|nr:hypothetical protein [Haliovirga abyssi]BDU50990.1 hypothetical protein HLVA_15590 [Haliovirga abyssi]
MKKIAVLLAGMLLVGGMVFADPATTSVNGKVEFTAIDMDSTRDGQMLSQTGDQYFKLNLTKQFDETTKVTAEYNTDEDSKDDSVASLTLTKQVNDKIEAAVKVNVDTTIGLKFADDEGGDTYLKYTASKDLNITLKPFEAGTGVGDELGTKDTQDAHGVEVNATLVDGLATTAVVNFANDGKDDKMGLKAGATYTGVENLSVTGEFSMNDTKATKTAVDARGSYKMGSLTLSGEMLNVTNKVKDSTTGKVTEKTGMGLFAKAAYDLGTLSEGVTANTNVSFKQLGEKLYYDGDSDRSIIGAGFDVVVNGLTISNSVEMTKTGSKVLKDKDGKATDSKTTFSTAVKVEF